MIVTDPGQSSRPAANSARRATQLAWLTLAALAYLPALASSPGRMPADSKLYVYLNPGRFFGDASSTFDPRQFGGWVPHQHMSYLWPTAPWFWTFERLGVPDWIAHRLWIGTLLLAAGSGVWWLARRTLGLSVAAALTAAVAYQASVYVLPYISRTSVMLLPWAGLGWIIALTARGLVRPGWRDPALIALVVVTVGGVNATALALIVPGPVLWLVHALRYRLAGWKDVWRVSWRTAVLSLGVSVWWIVMLTIQGRYGADVLAYSESLGDVSYTSTAPEVMRGLGYWLFYIRDNFAPTTTSSLRYLISTPAIVLSFGVTLLSLVGLASTRWIHRTFALALVATGAVLAVGVHPIADESPLMNTLTGGGQGGLALALRSSTRALPLMVLGLALGLATVVSACGDWARNHSRSAVSRRRRLTGEALIATLIIVLVLANNPTLVRGRLVDSAIDRNQDPPAAWVEAAAAIDTANTSQTGGDTSAASAGRVLQLPGVEFGAFRWGYTVDQPLPALTKAGLVTRDLLPLGSASTMDLLYALDDRVQDGVLEPGSVAPVARMLGARTVWLTNDVEYERFSTTRPQRLSPVLDAAPGLTDPTEYGPIEGYRTTVPMIQPDTLALPDQPTAAVALYQVEEPRPAGMATTSLVVLSGSGSGVVDAAAANLITGLEPIVYSASLADTPANVSAALSTDEAVTRLIVSDSNRDQARQWRSSQEAVGFTETGGPDQGVLRPIASDRRFDLFTTTDPSTQTVALQHGPVTAAATAYGEPFRYLPERRPYMAIDNDPSTSWTVGDHGDPVGEELQLSFATPLSAETTLAFQQAGRPTDRLITTVMFSAHSAEGHLINSWPVTFDPGSRSEPGQEVVVPADTALLTVRIDAVDAGIAFTSSAVAGVGFSEITSTTTGLFGSTVEVVRVPTDGTDRVGAQEPIAFSSDLPIDYVFTRWRTDPFDRARSDPEPTLVREFNVPERTLTAEPTVRVDPRADDDTLQRLFGLPATASGHLLGSIRSSAAAAVDADATTMWITPFDDVVGSYLRFSTTAPTSQLTLRQPLTGFSPITQVTATVGADQRTLAVTPDASGEATLTVDPPLPPGDMVITISTINPVETHDRRYGDPTTAPAAISDLAGPSIPVAAGPGDWTLSKQCVPVATIGDTTLTATLELAAGQGLDDPLVATPCVDTIDLNGTQRLVTSPSLLAGVQLDRVVLRDSSKPISVDQTPPTPVALTASGDVQRHTVVMKDCPQGCWLLDDVAANEGWSATDGSQRLTSLPLAGSGQAWLVPSQATDVAVDTSRETSTEISEPSVTVSWTQQRKFDFALLVSLLSVGMCIALAVRKPSPAAHEARGSESGDAVQNDSGAVADVAATDSVVKWVSPFPFGRRLTSLPRASQGVAAAVSTVALGATFGALLVKPIWGVLGALAAVFGLVVGRRLVDWMAVVILGVASIAIALGERQGMPLPDGGWPHHFESWHRVVMFAISLLALAACMPSRPSTATTNSSLAPLHPEPPPGDRSRNCSRVRSG